MRTVFASLLCFPVLILGCGDDDGTGGTGNSTATSIGGTGGDGAGSQGGNNPGGAPEGGGPEGGAASGGASEGGGGAGVGGAGGGGEDFYGQLTGTCGVIEQADLLSPDPQLVENTLDFSARAPFDITLLTEGSQEIFADGNLGGSSLHSEIFSYEVLYRCEDAGYLKSEAEIVYQTEGKKTDLLVEIDGERVGVSVVRAMSYPEGSPYPVSQAYDVLYGKLADILESSVNVAPEDSWPKQILGVIAQTPDHAAAIIEAYATVPPDVKADTIVYVTVTEGEDDFIYYNN